MRAAGGEVGRETLLTPRCPAARVTREPPQAGLTLKIGPADLAAADDPDCLGLARAFIQVQPTSSSSHKNLLPQPQPALSAMAVTHLNKGGGPPLASEPHCHGHGSSM